MSNFVNTVDSIGDEALTNSIIDRSITEIQDNYATSIGNYAFRVCSALTTVNFPAATSIGIYAFRDCSALTTADFLTATSVGNYAFKGCSALMTVNFPVATSIGEYAFSDCSALTTADFPAVTSVAIGAFSGCSALTTADFPAVTSIGESAFKSCSKLMTADFSTVTKIGNYAFSGCWGLTTADFPAATSIGNYAFRDCSKLTTVILRSATMATLGNANAFSSTPIKKGTGYIYVPAALVDSYKAASNWSTYANQFRAIEDYPEICDPYTWEAVAKHIELGDYATFYKVGDCVPLDLGSEGVVNMQIAAFDADDLADGSGKAPISWISEGLLATSHRMNPALVTNGDGTYQEGTGAIGGWEHSEMRTYLTETVKPLIPETVRNAIKSVTKTQRFNQITGMSDEQTTTDDIWIPSRDEIEGSNSLYYPLFKNTNTNRIKTKTNGFEDNWWCRNHVDKRTFCAISRIGKTYGGSANANNYIAIGFCT